MYKAIILKPALAPTMIELEIGKNNIIYLDTSAGSELDKMELNFSNVALEFEELEQNVYALSINTKGIQCLENEYFTPYSVYPVEKNITINNNIKYGDILIIGAYQDNQQDAKVYSLDIKQIDKYIKLLNDIIKK